METLTVDELTFEVRRSPRRKTLEITLDRAGDLIIAAPPEVGQERLTDFVREKRFWLYAKMAEKESLQQPLETKEFVSGEGFPYLGRSYRLLLVDDQDVPLKLEAGRFKLLRSLAPQGREHFISWYTDHARTWLQHRLRGWTSRMGLQPKGVDLRDLGFPGAHAGRLGTSTSTGPPSCSASVVAYVIVHELAHLREPNRPPNSGDGWSGHCLGTSGARVGWPSMVGCMLCCERGSSTRAFHASVEELGDELRGPRKGAQQTLRPGGMVAQPGGTGRPGAPDAVSGFNRPSVIGNCRGRGSPERR